jgi:hypothetical protein
MGARFLYILQQLRGLVSDVSLEVRSVGGSSSIAVTTFAGCAQSSGPPCQTYLTRQHVQLTESGRCPASRRCDRAVRARRESS